MRVHGPQVSQITNWQYLKAGFVQVLKNLKCPKILTVSWNILKMYLNFETTTENPWMSLNYDILTWWFFFIQVESGRETARSIWRLHALWSIMHSIQAGTRTVDLLIICTVQRRPSYMYDTTGARLALLLAVVQLHAYAFPFCPDRVDPTGVHM